MARYTLPFWSRNDLLYGQTSQLTRIGPDFAALLRTWVLINTKSPKYSSGDERLSSEYAMRASWWRSKFALAIEMVSASLSKYGVT